MHAHNVPLEQEDRTRLRVRRATNHSWRSAPECRAAQHGQLRRKPLGDGLFACSPIPIPRPRAEAHPYTRMERAAQLRGWLVVAALLVAGRPPTLWHGSAAGMRRQRLRQLRAARTLDRMVADWRSSQRQGAASLEHSPSQRCSGAARTLLVLASPASASSSSSSGNLIRGPALRKAWCGLLVREAPRTSANLRHRHAHCQRR